MKLHEGRKHKVREALVALAALAALAVLMTWSWNTLGHDLLGGPEAQYRHGLAAAALYGLLAALTRRWPRHRRHDQAPA